MASSSNIAKRQNLSNQEKWAVIQLIESGKKLTKVASDKNLPKSTVATWLKNRERIKLAVEQGNSKRKRERATKNDDVDKALFVWFTQIRGTNTPVDGALLLEKANELATKSNTDTVSATWIERWKKRHQISQSSIVGEAASVSLDVVTEWRESVLPGLLSRYNPKDIFNMDETGLFFRLVTDKTLDFKGKKCQGGKQSKERITVALTANMDGSEKLTPLIIGKFRNPRCFKNVRSLPAQYENNTKA